MKSNSIISFFVDLGKQIDEINTPPINGFLFQALTIFGVTVFFSIFFYIISFIFLRFLVWFYSM